MEFCSHIRIVKGVCDYEFPWVNDGKEFSELFKEFLKEFKAAKQPLEIFQPYGSPEARFVRILA